MFPSGASLAAAFQLKVALIQLEAAGNLDLGKRDRLETIHIAATRAAEVGVNIMVMPGTTGGGAGCITGDTMSIHDAVCQACLLEGLQHPEEGNAVRLVRERTLYIALRQSPVTAMQKIEHRQTRIGDPKVVRAQAVTAVHDAKDNLMQLCCDWSLTSHICNRVADDRGLP